MVDFNGKNEGKYINMDCLGNMSASFFVAVFFLSCLMGCLFLVVQTNLRLNK